jgi:hypothetical protein
MSKITFKTFKLFKPPPLSSPAVAGRMKEGVERLELLEQLEPVNFRKAEVCSSRRPELRNPGSIPPPHDEARELIIWAASSKDL